MKRLKLFFILNFLFFFSLNSWAQFEDPNWPLKLRPGSIERVTTLNSGQFIISGYCGSGLGDVSIDFGVLNFSAPCQNGLGVYYLVTDVSAEILTNPIQQCVTQGPFTVTCSNFMDNELAPPKISILSPLSDIKSSNESNYLISGGCAPGGALISIDIGAQLGVLSGTCDSRNLYSIVGDVSSVTDGVGITVTSHINFGGDSGVVSSSVDKSSNDSVPFILGVNVTENDIDSDGWLEEGDSFNIDIQFSENVVVDSLVSLGLFLNSGLKEASYLSGSGSSNIVFNAAVLSEDEQCDGNLGVSGLMLNGLGIKDFSNQDADLSSLPNFLSLSGVDAVGPEFGETLSFASSDATFTRSVIIMGDGFESEDDCSSTILEASITDSLNTEIQPPQLVPTSAINAELYRLEDGVDGFSFTLSEGEAYTVNLVSTDLAGNSSLKSSDSWGVSPIVNIPNIIAQLTGKALLSVEDVDGFSSIEDEFLENSNFIGDVSGSTNIHNFTARGLTQEPFFSTVLKEFEFDGVNDCMVTPNHPELNTATVTQRSYGALFRTDVDVTTRQIIYEEGAQVRGMNIYIDNGNVYCGFWNHNNDGDGYQAFVGQSAPVLPNTIYNVVPVFDYTNYAGPGGPNGTFQCYINGASMGAASSVTSRLFAHSGDVSLGCNGSSTIQHDGLFSNNQYFRGSILEFMVFNSPPNAAGILDIYDYMAITWGL